MKVLAVNKYYFIKGGAERYFFELSRILESRGHSVVPFAMRHELNEPTPYERYFVSNESFDDGVGALSRLRSAARVLRRPDPGPVDTVRALPLIYAVATVLFGMGAMLILADLVSPVPLG